MKAITKENIRITGRFMGALVLVLALMIAISSMTSGRSEAAGPPKHYPYKFDGEGQIDEFRRGEVIINDTHFKLAEGVRYYTPRNNWASKANFPKGTPVGYMVNSNREITAIYLIPETTE